MPFILPPFSSTLIKVRRLSMSRLLAAEVRWGGGRESLQEDGEDVVEVVVQCLSEGKEGLIVRMIV